MKKESRVLNFAFYVVVVFMIGLMALGTWSALQEVSESSTSAPK